MIRCTNAPCHAVQEKHPQTKGLDEPHERQLSDPQLAAQPSPPTVLPSSQTSPPSRTPSPHAGTVQSRRHAEGVENAVISMVCVRFSDVRASSPLIHDQLLIAPENVGAMVTVKLPGNGKTPMAPPSELFWNFHCVVSVVGDVFAISPALSSATRTTTELGKPATLQDTWAGGWVCPVDVLSMPWWKMRFKLPVVVSR